MKVLNLLTSGRAGGIESLCRDIGVNSDFENGFCFLFGDGAIYQQMKDMGLKTYCLSKIGEKNKLEKIFRAEKYCKRVRYHCRSSWRSILEGLSLFTDEDFEEEVCDSYTFML